MIGVAASNLLWEVLPVVEAIYARRMEFGTLLPASIYNRR
jgi:hypothetical protein